MIDTPLTPDMLPTSQYCQLGLRVGSDSLHVMIFNPMEDNSLIVREFPIPTDAPRRLKAIEDAVYANPLLLAEFKSVKMIVETPYFSIIPDAVNDDSQIRALMKAAHPEMNDGEEVIANSIEGIGAKVVSSLAAEEVNFLRRTFSNAPLLNSIVPLVSYMRQQLHRGNTIKAYVNIRESAADVIVMSRDRLYLANRFTFRVADDLVYYVLAAVTPADSSYEVSEILVTGKRQLRDEVLKGLRRFRGTVMPMIFPSAMYRAGRVAMTSPFDLIILPLCE